MPRSDSLFQFIGEKSGLEREDWVLVGNPSYDEQHRTWEYLIRTVDVEGQELHLKIAAVVADKRIEIITRW